ncbi:exo-beta-N-acetylmuramidase NamZ family protein [Calditrichota bacterium GD2]
MVQTGLDVLIAENFALLKNKKVGLLCNQASIASDFRHAIERFKEGHQKGRFELKALFGPQHGLFGHTQDNMIEWEGYVDHYSGATVYSLYGEHRKPTPQMLENIDVLVVDLQDVGARYYTFIWTMALCMEACSENDVQMVVLDRPNPIGGWQVEGPWLNMDFKSFVGWHPLPVRHGLTIGEVAVYLKERFYPAVQLKVVQLKNWRRSMYFDETGLPWGMPSPNMPTVDTAVVYPGMCLLEATNISEGRGTTRPFEIFGAPWMDHWQFSARMNELGLPGVHFRPLEFQPTFNKYHGEVCRGCFIHVYDRSQFKPFLTTIALLRETIQLYGSFFQWKNPPYEYEYHKMPFDILVGNDWLRPMLEQGAPLLEMEVKWQNERAPHSSEIEEVRLYE